MQSPFYLLRDQPKLRRLLEKYRQTKDERPDAEWHDRVMHLDDAGDREISRLHGLSLAHGWLETRVHPEAFHRPGVVQAAYRLTPDGNRALRSLSARDDVDDLVEEVSATPGSPF